MAGVGKCAQVGGQGREGKGGGGRGTGGAWSDVHGVCRVVGVDSGGWLVDWCVGRIRGVGGDSRSGSSGGLSRGIVGGGDVCRDSNVRRQGDKGSGGVCGMLRGRGWKCLACRVKGCHGGSSAEKGGSEKLTN